MRPERAGHPCNTAEDQSQERVSRKWKAGEEDGENRRTNTKGKT
jgi:hypothetical protein